MQPLDNLRHGAITPGNPISPVRAVLLIFSGLAQHASHRHEDDHAGS
jgi:hypothetical protein